MCSFLNSCKENCVLEQLRVIIAMTSNVILDVVKDVFIEKTAPFFNIIATR